MRVGRSVQYEDSVENFLVGLGNEDMVVPVPRPSYLSVV